MTALAAAQDWNRAPALVPTTTSPASGGNRLDDLALKQASLAERVSTLAAAAAELDPGLSQNVAKMVQQAQAARGRIIEARDARQRAIERLRRIEQRLAARVDAHIETLAAELDGFEARLELQEENLAEAAAAAAATPAPVVLHAAPPPAPVAAPIPASPVVMERAREVGQQPPHANVVSLPHDNRRAAARIELHAEIDLWSEDNFYTGFSQDLSETGIFITTVHVQPVGSEVALKFSLPGGARVEARAIVRWLREYSTMRPEVLPGMGLQFVEVSERGQATIHAFMAQREPLFFDH